MTEKNKSGIIVGIIIALAIIIGAIIISTSNKNNVLEPALHCEGVYMEYEGNCCLDENYNSICDSIDANYQIQDEGKVLTSSCSLFDPCPQNKLDYLNDGEYCRQSCENGRCVLNDCEIGLCSYQDECRYPSICDSFSKTCVVLG